MNILKKLKLTLLATSVMFFPKAGYTIKHEDEKVEAGVSRKLRTGGDDSLDLRSMESMSDTAHPFSPRPSTSMPAIKEPDMFINRTKIFSNISIANDLMEQQQQSSSSNEGNFPYFPKLKEKQMMRELGVNFTEDKEIRKQIVRLGSAAHDITGAIETHLLNKFAYKVSKVLTVHHHIYKPNDIALFRSEAKDMISFALNLSKEQIEQRSKAMAEKIPELMAPIPSFDYLPLPPNQLNMDSLIASHPLAVSSLVTSFLKLNPEQIYNRANAILENKKVLLLTKGLLYDKTTQKDPDVIKSLMDLEPEEIVSRVTIMDQLFTNLQEQYPSSSSTNTLKILAAHLKNEELNSRINRGISASEKSAELKPITKQLICLSLTQSQEHFIAYVHLLETNKSVRTQLGKVLYSDPVFSSSLEEFHDQLHRKHNSEYVLSKFLPALQSAFEEKNGMSVTIQQLETLFPVLAASKNLDNCDSEVLKEKINQAGAYKSLFKLPYFPDYKFSLVPPNLTQEELGLHRRLVSATVRKPILKPIFKHLSFFSTYHNTNEINAMISLLNTDQAKALASFNDDDPIFTKPLNELLSELPALYNFNYFFQTFVPAVIDTHQLGNKVKLERADLTQFFPHFPQIGFLAKKFDELTIKTPGKKPVFPNFLQFADSVNSELVDDFKISLKDFSEHSEKLRGNYYMREYKNPYPFGTSSSSAIESGGPSSSNGNSVDQEKIRQMTPSSSSTPAPAVTPAVKPALELDTPTFHMGKSSPYPTTGFSAFEGSHRWTVGNNASITLPLGKMEHPTSISFLDTRALVTGTHQQKLIVRVNGEEVKRYLYTLDNNNQIIDVPLPTTDSAEIEFEIPTAISPFKLVGTNPDTRELGISFREVQFKFD